MIIYFADRFFNILGLASTDLRKGLHIISDTKTESVETGVKIFECEITFDKDDRAEIESYTEAGNYLLRSQDDENEFYTIVETTLDVLNGTIRLYCEDAGLDMINDVCGAADTPDTAKSISYYVNKYAANSGFVIGTNEVSDLRRSLKWDGEDTAAGRIRSVATQFDNAEIGFSFAVKNLQVVGKYINIYKKRGDDRGVKLRLGQEVNNITVTKSVGDLATALYCKGAQDSTNKYVTLKGYAYDDGDIYSPQDSAYLFCRSANEKWTRRNWESSGSGWLVKQYSYETKSQATLCAHAVTKLKKLRDTAVNYEVEIADIGDKQIDLGDTIYIVDDEGGLYLSARVLQLETSVTSDSNVATLGDYLIKNSGISDKVLELANDFQRIAANIESDQTSLLQIASSNGLFYDNSTWQTLLTVTITRGSQQITNIEDLRGVYGSTATLAWYELQGESCERIPADDPRISDDGFGLTVSAAALDSSTTYKCELVVQGEVTA